MDCYTLLFNGIFGKTVNTLSTNVTLETHAEIAALILSGEICERHVPERDDYLWVGCEEYPDFFVHCVLPMELGETPLYLASREAIWMWLIYHCRLVQTVKSVIEKVTAKNIGIMKTLKRKRNRKLSSAGISYFISTLLSKELTAKCKSRKEFQAPDLSSQETHEQARCYIPSNHLRLRHQDK
ncbi:hypothetical protein DINM_006504 [Dirofilaria immitis]|nr:hypothetical protein [Dirofilaria immitis]